MIVLGLGSSIEPKKEYLEKALEKLNTSPDLKIIKRSKIYLTNAWGGVALNTFLNMCVAIEYHGTPYQLLKIINDIEYSLGRKRDVHWADRTIDIDILFFNDLVISDEKLVIPHRYLTKRNFVLYPLYDVVGNIFYEGKYLKNWCEENEEFITEYND